VSSDTGGAGAGIAFLANGTKLVKWRTGSEARISHLKRDYGWARTRVDGIVGNPGLVRVRRAGSQRHQGQRFPPRCGV